MSQIARVHIIVCRQLEVASWLRAELQIGLKEAIDQSRDGSVVEFDGDYKRAIRFYEYLSSRPGSSARLIIDFSYDINSGYTGALAHVVIEPEITAPEVSKSTMKNNLL